MILLLVEHDADGGARYILENGADTSGLARAVPVLAEHIPSIERCRWVVGSFVCLDCSRAWAGWAPEATNVETLECVHCGARRSTPIEDEWCSACGHEAKCAREPGCPTEGLECSACGQMAAMVQPGPLVGSV